MSTRKISFLIYSFILLLVNNAIHAQCEPTAYISEISYDNSIGTSGNDIDGIEFVEIAVLNGYMVEPWTIEYYTDVGNDGIGDLYSSKTISPEDGEGAIFSKVYYTVIFQDSTLFGFPVGGLSDALGAFRLLNHRDVVVDFVSWEGTLTVDGQTSQQLTDNNDGTGMPVQQNSAMDPSTSLQQNGFDGWATAVPQSVGMENNSFSNCCFNCECPLSSGDINEPSQGYQVVWNGTTGNWILSNNWEGVYETSIHGTGVYDSTRVFIPNGTAELGVVDVDSECVPHIFSNYCESKAYSVDISSGGTLDISSIGNLYLEDSLHNEGVLILNGTLEVHGYFDNIGSTVLQGVFVGNSDIYNTGTVDFIQDDITCNNFNNDGILHLNQNAFNEATVNGLTTFSENAAIHLGIGGNTHAGTDYDLLEVNGGLVLGGSLVVTLENGYNPATLSPLPIIKSSSELIGSFDDVVLPAGYSIIYDYDAGHVLLRNLMIDGDDCSSAQPLTIGDQECTNPVSWNTDTFGPSLESQCGGVISSSSWYEVTVTEESYYVISTDGNESETTIDVFSGTCEGLTSVGCGSGLVYESLVPGNYLILVSASNVDSMGVCMFSLESENNVGINESTPLATLDVNGGLKIGQSYQPIPGVLRFDGEKFEGYTSKWIDLGSADDMGDHNANTDIVMNDYRIRGLANPTIPNDAATKEYVDSNPGDDDDDPLNEIQTISIVGDIILLSDGGFVTIPETTWGDVSSTPPGFADGIDDVEDDDADNTNELITSITLNSTNLEIDEGNNSMAIDLASIATKWDTIGSNLTYNDGGVGISLGVGVAPDEKLVVKGTTQLIRNSINSDPQLRLIETDAGDGARINFTNSTEPTNNWSLYGRPDDLLADNTFNLYNSLSGNLMTIKGNGDIGLGKESPDSDLHIDQGNQPASDGIKLQNGTGNWWRMFVSSGTGDLRLYNIAVGNSSWVGRFDGTTGAYSTMSDRRKKENFADLNFEWNSFMSLTPMTYNFIHDSDKREDIGFIAQDMADVYPQLVSYDEDSDSYLMNYSGVGVIAVKAIQEQQKEIERMKKENADLKAEMDTLKNTMFALLKKIDE